MTIKEVQRERLKKYLAAEEAILLNQSYTIGARTFTRADLDVVRKMISDLIADGVTLEDDEEKTNRGRQKRVVFID